MLVLTFLKRKQSFISFSVQDPDKGRGRNNHSSALYLFLIKIDEKQVFSYILHASLEWLTIILLFIQMRLNWLPFGPSVDFRPCIQVRNKAEKWFFIVKLNFYPICMSSIELDTGINLVFLLYFISVASSILSIIQIPPSMAPLCSTDYKARLCSLPLVSCKLICVRQPSSTYPSGFYPTASLNPSPVDLIGA